MKVCPSPEPKRRRILFVSILTIALSVVLIYQRFFFTLNTTKAASITATAFTASSYVLAATNVTYTYTFTAPTTLSAANSDWIEIIMYNTQGTTSTNPSFCNASLANITDDGSDISSSGTGVVTSITPRPAENNICLGFTVPLGSGTIDSGSVISLQVSGVANPSSGAEYYPGIVDSKGNTAQMETVPHQAFGTPMLKVKVTEPDGSTAVANTNVWVHTTNYAMSGGKTTGVGGQAFIFSNDIYGAEGQSRDGTYVIEVGAPSSSSYTDPSPITGVSLSTGSTVDYTQGPLGPIRLSRPLVTGTLKVPSGCGTCNASAGDVVPNAEIDMRDTSYSQTGFKHVQTDSNGVFRIGGLAAATYEIEFKLPYDQQDYLGLAEPSAITDFVVNADGSVTYNSTTTTANNLPVNLGDIEFSLAAKTISGSVTKEGGVAVASVAVRAFKMMGMGMSQATTNSSGDYTLTVGGGTWVVMPEIDYSYNYDDDNNNDVTADWVYCGMPKSVSFADDNTQETSSGNNFQVKTANVPLTGRVTYPNGNPATGNVSVDIFSKDGCGTYAPVDWSDGSFSATLPPGTYNIRVNTWNENYGAPATTTVTLSSGTVDVGTLSLVEKSATITGRLWADANGNGSYDDGEGVGNIAVEGFKMAKKFDEFAGGMGGPMGGGDWASTTSSNSSATKGQFTLRVTKGTWIVNVMADMGMMNGGYSETSTNYIYTGSPAQVTISSDTGSSTGNDFELSIADATISGRIVDADTSQGISGVWGYAFAEPADSFNQGPMMGMGMGGPINNGSFTLKVPAGQYRVGVDFPPETSGYTPSSMATVTAVSGQTVTLDVTVVPNNATVRVQFKDVNGNSITGLARAEVFMDNAAGGHQWRMFSQADLVNGYADLTTAAGDWHIGYHIDPATNNYMSVPTTDNKVTAVANQTVTKNITLRVADSTVSGTVYDPNGNTLSGVWISTDSRKASNFDPFGGPMFMQGEMTGADGTYSLSLPAGTYEVAAFFPPEAVVGGQTVNYLNPESQEVTISSSSPATVNFTLGRSDATLSGTITLNGSNQGAFVAAYSNAGGYNEVISNNGSYSLGITKDDTWYIRAMYESGNNFYLSDVYEVVPGGSTSVTQNMTLSAASFTVPDAVSTTFNCANAKKITLSNGAEISIPASAIQPSSVSSCSSQDSSSNITVSVTPTAQMSLQDKSIPVGVGYEITATDSNGASISDTFNSNVTITIPYTDTQISESVGGTVDESLLGNGYWDTSTSAWKTESSQVLDTENNQVSIPTNHFTLFGILAATDPSTTGVAATSSTSSTSSDDGDTSEEDQESPYLIITHVGYNKYKSTQLYYDHPGGDLVIKGRGNPETEIVVYVNDERKTSVSAGSDSWWDYVVYNPVPGTDYKFDIYAQNSRLKLSKIYNFYVRVGGTNVGVGAPSITPSGVTADDYELCGKTYEIKAGDSLWSIASSFWQDGSLYPILIAFNSGIDVNTTLQIGDTLSIPCKETSVSKESAGEEKPPSLPETSDVGIGEKPDSTPGTSEDHGLEEGEESRLAANRNLLPILAVLVALGAVGVIIWLFK